MEEDIEEQEERREKAIGYRGGKGEGKRGEIRDGRATEVVRWLGMKGQSKGATDKQGEEEEETSADWEAKQR